MGSYTFSWAHPAEEVFVTGDFDDWKKTIKLEKEDGVFKKTVELPSGKHQYKFVVDGNWLTNDSHPKEEVEGKGIYNNVLHPHDLQSTGAAVSGLSSAAPESSTAALAGAVPKEQNKKERSSSDSLPGAFPLTPPAATPGSEPQAFSVDPIPASSGLGNPIQLAAGESVPHPNTFTDNTVQSAVKLDEQPELETVSVAPIPATAGLGNPIHLAPGEKVPHPSTFTSNTVSSTAKTDAASYNKSDAFPPQLAPVLMTPEAERQAKGGMFALPPLTGSLIPESSLPKDANTEIEKDTGVTIQSAAPNSTTAGLAGQVPLESNIPQPPSAVLDIPAPVLESQNKAHRVEASANPEAVDEKKEVESELKQLVPEQPATSENFIAAENVPHSVVKSQEEVKESAEAAANPAAVEDKHDVERELLEKVPKLAPTVPDVPYEVIKSQREAHAPQEASANPLAVEEKSQVEEELLKKVPEQPAAADNTYATQAKKTATAVAGTVATGATVAASALAAATYSAKDKAADTISAAANYPIREKAAETAASTQEKAADTVGLAKEKTAETVGLAQEKDVDTTGSNGHAIVPEVPDVVVESQRQAHSSPEASAEPQSVLDKKHVEKELLQEIKPTDQAGEPAPMLTAETTATAPGASLKPESGSNKASVATGATETIGLNNQPQPAAVAEVPDVVAESQREAHASPEASANEQSVLEKKAMEKELLQETWKTSEPGEPAPAITADLAKPAPNSSAIELKPVTSSGTAAVQPAEPLTFQDVNDSRDVSPMSKQTTTASQTQPIVTTGVESGTTEAKSESKPEPATTTQTQPTVTSGVETGTTEAKSEQPATATQTQPTVTSGAESGTMEAKTTPETPQKATAHAPERSDSTGASDKKKKRQSFFSKLKSKFKDI